MDSRVNLTFFHVVFYFDNYILIILLPASEWFKKSAFKEEKSWRFDSEVSNSRRHDSILFFLLGREYRWGGGCWPGTPVV